MECLPGASAKGKKLSTSPVLCDHPRRYQLLHRCSQYKVGIQGYCNFFNEFKPHGFRIFKCTLVTAYLNGF